MQVASQLMLQVGQAVSRVGMPPATGRRLGLASSFKVSRLRASFRADFFNMSISWEEGSAPLGAAYGTPLRHGADHTPEERIGNRSGGSQLVRASSLASSSGE